MEFVIWVGSHLCTPKVGKRWGGDVRVWAKKLYGVGLFWGPHLLKTKGGKGGKRGSHPCSGSGGATFLPPLPVGEVRGVGKKDGPHHRFHGFSNRDFTRGKLEMRLTNFLTGGSRFGACGSCEAWVSDADLDECLAGGHAVHRLLVGSPLTLEKASQALCAGRGWLNDEKMGQHEAWRLETLLGALTSLLGDEPISGEAAQEARQALDNGRWLVETGQVDAASAEAIEALCVALKRSTG